MAVPYVYSPECIASLVRTWIERGEKPEEIEGALKDKIQECYSALLPKIELPDPRKSVGATCIPDPGFN